MLVTQLGITSVMGVLLAAAGDVWLRLKWRKQQHGEEHEGGGQQQLAFAGPARGLQWEGELERVGTVASASRGTPWSGGVHAVEGHAKAE